MSRRSVQPIALRMEDFPDLPEGMAPLLESIMSFSRDVSQALAEVPQVDISANHTFQTDSTGAATVDIKNGLDVRPAAVVKGKLTVFGTEAQVATAHGFSWTATDNGISCLLSGLTASTKYRLTVAIFA